MVLNVRGLKESISSEKGPFAALLGNSSSNNFVSLLYKDKQSCPWPLVESYLIQNDHFCTFDNSFSAFAAGTCQGYHLGNTHQKDVSALN